MTTITIPKNLMKEKDLMIVPRLKYERLLKSSKMIEQYERLWENVAKGKFLKSYGKFDAIYEEQDTDQAIAIYKKEKKQGKLKVLKSLASLR